MKKENVKLNHRKLSLYRIQEHDDVIIPEGLYKKVNNFLNIIL